jgi:hypothetical protein
MKTTILRATCILASLIGPAFSAKAETLIARIPFDFVAGATAMPAGEYRFTMDTRGILLIQGDPPILSSTLVSVQADSVMSRSSPSAGFDKTANSAVFSRITLPSGSAYSVLSPVRGAKSPSLTDGSALLFRH